MVCPALLYGMISKSCAEDEHNFQVNGSSPVVRNDLTWVYSIVAVFLISACGVLSLAIIPVMQKRFYNQLIQFLVALAVGTLAGDALLHLLPHAMSSNQNDAHQGDHGGHDENTWKGFVAMLDIMDNPSKTICESDRTAITVLELDSNSDIQSCQKSRSPTTEKLETNQNMNESTCTEENKMLPPEERHDHEDYTVIVREHKSEHHGHSHKHGHVHAAPQNYSSVAWMVIMGDGLHNFTDGMAIGAAFSEGLAGGFSTTVAVFCHELPHELGDFAMLLKAGMSIKQALFYNILSSLLCLLGSFFGLWIGNTDYASSWVFATAAGMFIYIALVDMIPN
ncbi:hypothetical protein NQ317_003998 [Molorchus minor]|uniref:Uncharacterized protein n=1 Tax=Molorchus minor TaxID=1323400 RepID=A0ABQ9IZJ5_9CUCU|nr:hypothetical protein NQ317_003998 [Molorchus minor]